MYQQPYAFHQLKGLDHQLKWDVGGGTGVGVHGVEFYEGVPVKLYIWEALIVLFSCSLLGSIFQAQLSSVIADRFLALDIHVFASHLVGEAEYVSAAGQRVLRDFLFSLWFCQTDSMFGKALGLVIFLLAARYDVLNVLVDY